MKVEEILREEILKAFLKLIFVYIIGTVLIIILASFFTLTSLLVPLRLSQNVSKFRILV